MRPNESVSKTKSSNLRSSFELKEYTFRIILDNGVVEENTSVSLDRWSTATVDILGSWDSDNYRNNGFVENLSKSATLDWKEISRIYRVIQFKLIEIRYPEDFYRIEITAV